MRNAAFILGAILLIVGGLIAAGVFKFQDTEKVGSIGPIEVSKTEEKKAPLNLGYILLGLGAVSLVGGALVKK